MYDLILFNNATKQCYVYPSMRDSGTEIYYRFTNVDLGDIPYGEYEYALIFNELGTIEYEFNNSLLGTLLHFEGETYRLTDLAPELGLLKYVPNEEEAQEDAPVYRDTDTEYYYRRK